MSTPVLQGVGVAIAVTFGVVNGMNNGGALAGIAVGGGDVPPFGALGVLGAALFVVPLVLGAPVATTLAHQLLDGSGAGAEVAFLVGIVAAMVVVGLLVLSGRPTSLTLATMGGLVGAGLGAGLRVDWSVAVLAVVLALVAPVVAAVLAFGTNRVLSRLRTVGGLDRQWRWLARLTFVLQAIAYAFNDGQRMLAVFSVVLAGGLAPVHPGMAELAILAGVFCVGTEIGVRRLGRSLGNGVVSVVKVDRASAQVASALCALASSAGGVPVSITQTSVGGLAGSHATRGRHRIRWGEALRLVEAWGLTLPASLLLAAGASALVLRSFGVAR